MKFTRKENGVIANTNGKKGFILKLLNDHARYIRRKIGGIYRKLVKKTDNNGGKQKNRSKWIDKLRNRIKNKRKSENSNTIDNNTIANNTTDNTINNITIDNTNETYDNKISDKIRDIRVILSRLGNIVTKKDKKKIEKEIYDHLDKLLGTFVKKDKHKHKDHDELDYYGIRDIENLFDDYNDNDYYKPILVKSSFNESYKKYESRGDKDKTLSVEQCLNMIIPYLKELINNHKAIRNGSNEWKIQLNIH